MLSIRLVERCIGIVLGNTHRLESGAKYRCKVFEIH